VTELGWVTIPTEEFERLHAALTKSEAENDQWQKKVAELWAERERINAEWREQIQVEHAAYQELRVENERLRAEVADLLPGMDADAMTISNLARENERLRAALAKGSALVEDMDLRMPDQATEDADGWINSYRIPVGPWHRLLGWSRGEAQSMLTSDTE